MSGWAIKRRDPQGRIIDERSHDFRAVRARRDAQEAREARIELRELIGRRPLPAPQPEDD